MRPTLFRPLFLLALGLAAVSAARGADADNIEWISISLPTTGGAGAMLQFNATVKNTGTTTWDHNCYLELKDAAGTPIDYPSVAGVAPGQTVSRMFLLYLPGPGEKTYTFKGLRHNVATFGPAQTRAITVVAGAVNQGVTLTGPQNASGSYILDTSSLPFINSADALTPNYRLRAKIIDGSYMGWGHHAATTWNNKGLRLDSAPATPGTYPVTSLYWLKYDAFQGTLLEVGPERFVSVNVPGGTVALEHYSFGHLSPPKIFSDEPTLAGTTYWLDATFKHQLSGQEWLATPRPANAPQGSHNNHTPLVIGNLPPPGQYDLKLSWRRFDGLGNLFATGPDFPVGNVVIYAGEGPVLNVSGSINLESGYDDDGNWGSWLTEDSHEFIASITGTVMVSVSALFGIATEVLDGNGNTVAAGGSSLSFPTTGGTYTLKIRSADGGTGYYTATAEVHSAGIAPSYSSTTDTVAGEFGKNFSLNVSAGGTGPVAYTIESGALPPGLGLSGNGVILGVPAAASPAGSPWVATVRAQNAYGHALKTVTLVIAKATPVLVPGSFSAVTRTDVDYFPITASMLNAQFAHPTGFSTPPPTPVTYKARVVATGEVFSPFTTATFVGLGYAHSPLLVTAKSPANENYESFEVTVSFDCKDIIPPAAPVPRVALTTSTSFTVSWPVPADNFGVTGYEVILDGNTAQPYLPTVPSHTFTGLQPGSTHTVRVRARDQRENWSQPATVSATTLPAGTSPAYPATWVDVNNDGIRDEIYDAPEALDVVVMEESQTEISYTTWVQQFIQLPGFWSYQSVPRRFRESNQYDYYPYYVPGETVTYWDSEEQTLTIDKGLPRFSFVALGGDLHSVVRVFESSNGGPTRYGLIFTPEIFELPGAPASIHHLEPSFHWPLTAIFAFPTKAVRIGLPPAGPQINLPGIGNITLRAGAGGVSGTMTLPGNITLTAGSGGVTISNGTATVAVNAGTTTVNIALPGGYQVTGVSNGTVSISGPGGYGITTGPSGTTLAGPGGVSITVNGTGAIFATLPQGEGTGLTNVVDILGRAIGLGPVGSVIRAKVVPQGGDPNLVIWENGVGLDLGNRAPGVYIVGTTSDERTTPAQGNVIWFTLTIRPQVPNLLKIWETKNKANQIYNATPKDDPTDDNFTANGASRHKLFVVEDPADGKYRVTISCAATGNTPITSFRAKVVHGLFELFSIAESDVAFSSSGEANLVFTMPPPAQTGGVDFTLKIGFDANGNSQLDSNEANSISIRTGSGVVVGNAVIHGLPLIVHTQREGLLRAGLEVAGFFGAVPISRNCLRIFLDGGTANVDPGFAPTSGTFSGYMDAFTVFVPGSSPPQIDPANFAEWLTHNSGAAFDANGITTSLPVYQWDELSPMAAAVADAKETRKAIRDHYNSVVKPQVDAFFAANPNATETLFPFNGVALESVLPAYFNWSKVPGNILVSDVPNVTVNYHAEAGLDDIQTSLGRARLQNHDVRYRIVRGTPLNLVTVVRSTGVASDLYDFNIEQGGFATWAATVQIGQGNGNYVGRGSGKIYRHVVTFDRVLPHDL